MPLWNQILNLQEKMADLRKVHFFQDILWTYQWWILVLTTLVLWTVWVILVDTKRLRNILLVGLLSLAFSLVLDDFGISMARWNYPYKIVYFTTRLSVVDMVILPVAFMIIYQYFRKWISYIFLCILFASFASFIAEPLFVKLNMYTLENWRHIYSAPIYVGIGIIVKGADDFVEWLVAQEQKEEKIHKIPRK